MPASGAPPRSLLQLLPPGGGRHRGVGGKRVDGHVVVGAVEHGGQTEAGRTGRDGGREVGGLAVLGVERRQVDLAAVEVVALGGRGPREREASGGVGDADVERRGAVRELHLVGRELVAVGPVGLEQGDVAPHCRRPSGSDTPSVDESAPDGLGEEAEPLGRGCESASDFDLRRRSRVCHLCSKRAKIRHAAPRTANNCSDLAAERPQDSLLVNCHFI